MNKSLLAKTLTRNAMRRLGKQMGYANKNGPPIKSCPLHPKVLVATSAGKALSETVSASKKAQQGAGPSGGDHNPPVVEEDVAAPREGYGPPPIINTILFVSHQRQDTGVVYEIRDDETFEVIYEDYASRVDLAHFDIILKKDGLTIAEEATAASMRIRSGDVIYVSSVRPGKNLNTRQKYFYVRNTCTPYNEVSVYARRTTKIRRIA